jgi:S1-C subfamily serine protease
VKQLWVGLLAIVLSLAFLIELRLVDRLAYQVEAGRLRAMQDALKHGVGGDPGPSTGRLIADSIMPAVVTIETERRAAVAREEVADAGDPRGSDDDWWSLLERFHAGVDPEAAPSPDQPGWMSVEQGIGSGFVVDADLGYVLTNAHVVDGADAILVTLADGRATEGVVLGSDRQSDVALLQIDTPDLHEVRFGDSDMVYTGDAVYSFGNPLGLSGTMSRGIVSAINRNGVILNEGRYPGLLQTDAVISPGSSGGPLVNARGEVVGVNAAIATTTGQFDGVGFAIPANKVKPLLADLVEGGPSMLGVWIASLRYSAARSRARELGWHGGAGALITDVMEGMAAERAGLEPEDIILAVDGSPIEEGEDLVRLVSSRLPGTRVTVEVWRDGDRLDVPVILDRKYAPR